jgi:RimJ/RimL family protein N-acetyltransferase
MKYIGSHKKFTNIWTKDVILDYIEDEKKQIKLPPYQRMYRTYAIMDENTVVGFFGLNNFIRAITKYYNEINYENKEETEKDFNKCNIILGTRVIIGNKFQGKGYGTKAYELIWNEINKLFATYNTTLCIVNFVWKDNIPGQKLQIKCGFKFIGTYLRNNLDGTTTSFMVYMKSIHIKDKTIRLKNIAYLTDFEINQMAKITSKPEVMKYIGDGKPYTKKDIIGFVNDEKHQFIKNSYQRNFWTYAIILDNNIIGLFALYKISIGKYINNCEFINYNIKNYISKITGKPAKNSKKQKRYSRSKKQTNWTNHIVISTRRLLDIEHQGKGYGYQVSKLVEDIINYELFPSSYNGQVDLITFVDKTNRPSLKLQEKVGYKLIGTYTKDNHIYNMYHWKIK